MIACLASRGPGAGFFLCQHNAEAPIHSSASGPAKTVRASDGNSARSPWFNLPA